jgi:ubiquinone/menaquinone biosynthesis C-methylase UbiE
LNNPPVREPDRIRDYWSQQAIEHGAAPCATTPDRILRDMEIATILKYLDGEDVLDLGCGNGFSTLQFAAVRPGRYLGVDFSPEMIAAAEQARRSASLASGASLGFQVGDATALTFSEAAFDVVTTDRCLINLISLEAQRRALTEIHRVVRPGGRYVMCENTQQGLAKLNQFREVAGLPLIGTRWHNLYLDEEALGATWSGLFQLETIDNFSSLYYLASRIFNARLAQDQHQDPSYDHPLNQLAARLPSFGDIGPLKVFVFRKA